MISKRGIEMGYIDGFVVAVPDKNKEAYKRDCSEVANIFFRYGALRIVECWGDDVPDGVVTDFKRAVKLEPGETVVFSWIMWPDRKTRDEGGKKVHEEISKLGHHNPVFDGKRMIWGGFEVLLDAAPDRT